MKPLFILLTVLSSFFAKNSLAADHISPEAVKSFEQTFTNASNIVWTVKPDFYKVDFILNTQAITAFYNTEGKLTAVTRNITSFQLPLVLQTEIRKEYANYWITDLFELSNDNGTAYYLTVENADNKIVLKSVSNAEWSTYSKIRK